MSLRCPYCNKSVPNKRHQGLCPKRPGRPQGASRKGSQRRPKPHKEPIGVVEQAENDSAAGESVILAAPDDVAEDAMPDFSDGTPMFDAAPPAQQPTTSSTPPPAAPAAVPIQDQVLWESVVSFICDGVDAAVKGQVGEKSATPQPPESITPEKRKQLAEAIGAAVAAYGGGAAQLLGKWGPAINLAFVAGAIFLPTIMQARAYIAWKQAEEKRAKEAEARAKAIGSGPLAAATRVPSVEDEAAEIERRMIARQAEIERDGQLARRA